MRVYSTVVCLGLAVSLLGCKYSKEKKEHNDQSNTASEMQHEFQKEEISDEVVQIILMPKSGSEAKGTVVFMEKGNVVRMKAELEGLSPGTHAVHLHETADCSSHDAKSTGGHWNPTDSKHGAWGDADGYHRGDIGNFEADANGNATIDFETNQWCIGCDDPEKDILGRGLIVHQGEDDLQSQPSGDAGKRVACASIDASTP